MIQQLTDQQALQLLRLRTVIARAAQKDSLRWWEDESLTTQGTFLLERIFPGAPTLSGRNLAIAAAANRHQAALEDFDNVIHLFRASSANVDRLAMRAIRHHFVAGITHLSAPIPDFDTLGQHLLNITGRQPSYEVLGMLSQHNGLRIRLTDPTADLVERAYALAWAYLEGKMDKPVFPYMVMVERGL